MWGKVGGRPSRAQTDRERKKKTYLCDPLRFVPLLLLPRLEEVLSGLELQIDLFQGD